MAVIPDFGKTTLTDFATRYIAYGTTIYTDGLKQFSGLKAAGYTTSRAPSRFAREGRPSCRASIE